jgi:hypothetical protein
VYILFVIPQSLLQNATIKRKKKKGGGGEANNIIDGDGEK